LKPGAARMGQHPFDAGFAFVLTVNLLEGALLPFLLLCHPTSPPFAECAVPNDALYKAIAPKVDAYNRDDASDCSDSGRPHTAVESTSHAADKLWRKLGHWLWRVAVELAD